MIIFCVIIFFLSLLLMLKIKLSLIIKIRNTKTYFEIHSMFFNYRRYGSFKYKDSSKNRNTKIKNKEKKNKILNFKKIKFWFFRHIKYEKVNIYEKIGLLDPAITAFSIPFLSAIITIPLFFLNIDYDNFKYKSIPDYNNLVFVLDLDANASFSILNILQCIIKEKLSRLNSRT